MNLHAQQEGRGVLSTNGRHSISISLILILLSVKNMRQKHLESALSQLQREFPSPKAHLEQYVTSPSLAAAVALHIRNDVLKAQEQGNEIGSILDLGCGTGMLGLATAMAIMEEDPIVLWGVDCDEDALNVACQNATLCQDELEMDLVHVPLVAQLRMKQGGSARHASHSPHTKGGRSKARGRGRSSSKNMQHSAPASSTLHRINLANNDGLPLQDQSVDLVVTNPPFGTKADMGGMDVQFLVSACRVARYAVYSFHKTSTRSFLVATLPKLLPYRVESIQVVAEMKFDVPQTYSFHKQKNVDIAVDLIRVRLKQTKDIAGDVI